MTLTIEELLVQLSLLSTDLSSQCENVDIGCLEPEVVDFLLPFPPLSINIPEASSFISDLLDAGAPRPFAEELSQIHVQYALHLAEQYRDAYHESCTQLLNARRTCVADRMKMAKRLQLADQRMYQSSISRWSKDVVESVRARFPRNVDSGPVSQPNRNSFNSAFIPVLEACFKDNPFPSHAVRHALAKRSGMKLRQISVWFQNHRSRSKKDIDARNVSPPDSNYSNIHISSSVEIEEGCISDTETVLGADIESKSICKSVSSRSSSFTLYEEGDDEPFDTKSPIYAFPTTYPPELVEDPFPYRSGGTFAFTVSETLWRRRPATKPITRQNIDIGALASAFAQLSLSSVETSDSCQQGPFVHSASGTECSYPFVTVTHPAPLPSLITCIPRCQRVRKTHLSHQGTPLVDRWGRRCHRSLSREIASVFHGSKLQAVKATRAQMPWRMPSVLASNIRPSSLFAFSVQ